MRAAEWKRVVRPLIPTSERWEFRAALCYRAPVGRFLFGVLGEGSGFDSGVYLWRVSMPMFVPSDFVVLSYSRRIGGGSKKYDSADTDELSAAIAGGFRDVPTETDELRRLINDAQGSRNLRLLDAAANSRVLLGDEGGAIETIKQASALPIHYEWESKIITRLTDLARTLKDEGLQAAKQGLDAQIKSTAVALGVISG